VVSNTGNETATLVTVSDTVPAHTTYVPGSIAGGDSRDDSGLPVLVWVVNSLAPGQAESLSYAVTVSLPLTNSLQIVNTGAVTCTQVPTPTTDTVTDTVTSSHTLEVVKSAQPSLVQAGALLTYTLAYTITGDEPVYGVVVSDTTPANTTFYTATPPATSDPGVGGTGPVIWNLGDFLPPESGTTQATGVLTLVVRVDSPLVSGTVIYNAVAITDTSGLTDTDEVTTPVQSSHSLSVTKTASPSPVQDGELLTYTLAWAVSGNEPAFGVTISDTVPQSTTYQACYGGLSCGHAGGVVTWALGNQYPPASGVVTLVVRVDSGVPAGAFIYNAVAITDTSGLTDTDDITTPVQTRADLAVTKSDDPDPVIVGTLLTYTLLVTNNGPSVARNAVVTDTLPPEGGLRLR
jgi:conserved repeat domain